MRTKWQIICRGMVDGVVLRHIRRSGRGPWLSVQKGFPPQYVQQYLNLSPTGLLQDFKTIEEFKALEERGDLKWQMHFDGDCAKATIWVDKPKPPEKPIEVKYEDGGYVGRDGDGGRYRVGFYKSRSPKKQGWYLSCTIDSDTGGFVMDTVHNDGPYPTKEAALLAGRDHCTGWCIDNNVRYEGNPCEIGECDLDHYKCSECGISWHKEELVNDRECPDCDGHIVAELVGAVKEDPK